MRIAVGQLASVPDHARNLAAAARLVGRAGAAGADLVVLPEYTMEPFGAPDAPPASGEPLDGPFVSGLVGLAGAHGVTVVAGMTEAGGGGLPFNTVVVVSADGVLARYRKVHLFDAFGWQESSRLRPGNPADLVVTPVAGLAVGVLTCYDLRFPEIARVLVDRGAEVLVVPAAWVAGPLKEHQWTTLITARAVENTCWVAGAGQSPPAFAGRSLVVDPMGVVVAGVGAEPEALAVADLTADAVASARLTVPSLTHRRWAVTER